MLPVAVAVAVILIGGSLLRKMTDYPDEIRILLEQMSTNEKKDFLLAYNALSNDTKKQFKKYLCANNLVEAGKIIGKDLSHYAGKYCTICRKEFVVTLLDGTNITKCPLCEAIVCTECVRSIDDYASPICSSCEAVNPEIEVWSINYKGKVPEHSADVIALESGWYKNKDRAVWELKYLANKKYKADIIYDLDFTSTTKGNNYIFKIWQAKAKASKLVKN